MEILFKAAQLLLSLSILIVLHELGHFIPAKIFKTRVEKFYLFFDWKFSLFKMKKGETEYGIGWLPLGGYVKIAGMIDESMDKEQMKQPPQPWEFRAKPVWQRLIIMLGGVTVNLILGAVIYTMIMYVWGMERLPLKNAPYGVHADSLMKQYGFRDGDVILAVDSAKPYDLKEFQKRLILDKPKTVTVSREGQPTVISLPENFNQTLLANTKRNQLHFYYRFPGIVDSIIPTGGAAKSTLQVGDTVIAINGKPGFAGDFFDELQNLRSQSVVVDVVGPAGPRKVDVVTDSLGKMGVYWKEPTKIFKTEKTSYSFLQAIPAGFKFGWERLRDYVQQIPLIFTKEGVKQLGGFASMGSMFAATPKEFTWLDFWNLTAFISIALAFMNVLPIPALDGGHVVFLLWEWITGKPASEKVLEYAQYVGLAIILSLLLFANGNDIFRSLTGGWN